MTRDVSTIPPRASLSFKRNANPRFDSSWIAKIARRGFRAEKPTRPAERILHLAAMLAAQVAVLDATRDEGLDLSTWHAPSGPALHEPGTGEFWHGGIHFRRKVLAKRKPLLLLRLSG